jgi:hypothetical protein
MDRPHHTIGRVVGYHGCDLRVAKRLLTHKAEIEVSENEYDWLGDGAYFWVDSAQRGIEWAIWKAEQEEIKNPCVVGAFIHLGHCLSLFDFGVMDDITSAHARLQALFKASKQSLPKNELKKDGFYLKRFLDCAVINMIHLLRAEEGKPEYDTVIGIFEEGPTAYQGAGFKKKTHIQVAVRNPNCIIGYFQVRGYEIFK